MASFQCLRLKFRRNPVRVGESGFKKETEARRLTMEQVEKLTMNFSRSRVIAFGGFSTVYLGLFPDYSLAAVKIMDCSSSKRLDAIFKQELHILQRIQHDSIVKVLGYSDGGNEEGVLVLEYVVNGTLQENLNGKWDSVLSWKKRMGIGYQLAQALEYLHERCDPSIIHGDIKASNILLDSQLNCKLCDFGSAKTGFSSSRVMIGSPGYTDPHYLRTGIATKKSDIYSFGVVLLELITGLEASDCSGRLVWKASEMLKEESEVAKMVDPKLCAGEYELEEAKTVAFIATLCLVDSPASRPTATDILEIMRSRVSSLGS